MEQLRYRRRGAMFLPFIHRLLPPLVLITMQLARIVVRLLFRPHHRILAIRAGRNWAIQEARDGYIRLVIRIEA